MRLDSATWPEVEVYLQTSSGIFLPAGSTEQHGPMGLIGTDAFCAELIAAHAAEATNTYVAPTLAYTPAPFNTSFPGTISLSTTLFEALAVELFSGFISQGFSSVYVVNGHGANIEPLKRAANEFKSGKVRVRSWWDFNKVNTLRRKLYGDWEGMHATPSEISITQTVYRAVSPGASVEPPDPISVSYERAHAGDRHGPPDEHRKRFPDGRVGSHSALACAEHGEKLLEVAVNAVIEDFNAFDL